MTQNRHEKKFKNLKFFNPKTQQFDQDFIVSQVNVDAVEYQKLQEAHLHYDQNDLIGLIYNDPDNYKKLRKIELRFNGLCELISNFVILNDLLGKHKDQDFYGGLSSGNFSYEQTSQNLLKLKITPDSLNTPVIKKSHILDVSSFFQKMLAFLFNIYPYSLFSFMDKVQIDKKVNQALISEKFNALDDSTYIKFMVFHKTYTTFTGHSMLIKKTGNAFSFFDPNKGEYCNLNMAQLCKKINEAMIDHDGTHMCFMDAKKFVANLNLNLEDKDDLEATPPDITQQL